MLNCFLQNYIVLGNTYPSMMADKSRVQIETIKVIMYIFLFIFDSAIYYTAIPDQIFVINLLLPHNLRISSN